jgi:hypothetical protein
MIEARVFVAMKVNASIPHVKTHGIVVSRDTLENVSDQAECGFRIARETTTGTLDTVATSDAAPYVYIGDGRLTVHADLRGKKIWEQTPRYASRTHHSQHIE